MGKEQLQKEFDEIYWSEADSTLISEWVFSKLKEAWDEGYSDGCSDAQSYNAGYPQKAKNPYSEQK